MKKFLSLALAAVMCMSLLAGCGSTDEPSGTTPDANEEVTLQVAALASAYMDKNPNMWQDVCDAFTDATGIKVQLTAEKMLEDVIGPAFKSGNGPDFVHLATGRELALTETFIRDHALADVTDVLDMTIPGESVKVGEKIMSGFTDTAATNPYGDGKTYLFPMFNGPCGLFYNAALLEEKGWSVPTTWDEMWELGDKAAAEGIALFTYPTHGYLNEFMISLIYSVGGPELFQKIANYEEGAWETEGGKQVLDIMVKLASYTHKSVPAHDNTQDFTKNQQLILDNEAIFCPNGTWLPGEMKDAPRAEGFKWAMAPIPAVEAGGSGYCLSWIEQCWIPASAEHMDAAKQFMAFMYSDKAAEIFAACGAYQPINGIMDAIKANDPQTAEFYGTLEQPGVKAAIGAFAPSGAVEGVSLDASLYGAMNSLVSGNLSAEDYVAGVIATTDALRAAMG